MAPVPIIIKIKIFLNETNWQLNTQNRDWSVDTAQETSKL